MCNSLNIVTGTYFNEDVKVTVKFHLEDIQHEFGFKRTHKEVQRIADILAANVEEPTEDEDGCVEIDDTNFNDCFYDMIDDIKQDI